MLLSVSPSFLLLCDNVGWEEDDDADDDEYEFLFNIGEGERRNMKVFVLDV